MLLLLTIRVSVPIAVAATPSDTTPVIATLIVVEATGESSRLRELVLRRGIEVVTRGWVWEIWVDSGGTVVKDGFPVGGLKEPGGVVGLLHGVCCGRGGWAKAKVDILSPPGRRRSVTSYPRMPPPFIDVHATATCIYQLRSYHPTHLEYAVP